MADWCIYSLTVRDKISSGYKIWWSPFYVVLFILLKIKWSSYVDLSLSEFNIAYWSYPIKKIESTEKDKTNFIAKSYIAMGTKMSVYNTLYHKYSPSRKAGSSPTSQELDADVNWCSKLREWAIPRSTDCFPNAGPMASTCVPMGVLTFNHPSGVQIVCLVYLCILKNVGKKCWKLWKN